MHLIIGYVEWILNLLPVEYEIIVERNDRNAAGDSLFKEIRRVLEDRYRDITLNDLIEQFGHNKNYYNRLIKTHAGITFSTFMQNIKLEKAELLLKTTEYPVEEIARRVGYENLSYFYKIFCKKFSLTPNNLRNLKFSTDLLPNPR
jgi:YesN/AraC family two-component response regulator